MNLNISSHDLKISNLTICYDKSFEPSVKNINIDINRKECVLLMGNTGSGKSTLLKSIAGIIPKIEFATCSGEISVLGKNPNEFPIFFWSRFVALMLQNPDSQFCTYKVSDEIDFCLEQINFERDKDTNTLLSIRNKILEESCLLPNELIHNLSGGQKQRLLMSITISIGAPVLLFDEPFSHLDPPSIILLIDWINNIKKNYQPLIIITEQKIEHVISFIDRVIVLEKGSKILDSKIETAFGDITLYKKNNISLPFLIEYFRSNFLDLYKQHGEFIRNKYNKKLPNNKILEKKTIKMGSQKTTEKDVIFSFKKAKLGYKKVKKQIFDELNFDILEEDRIAILGPNGSGKSTLLKGIAGVLPLISGKRYILAGKRPISFLFQEVELMFFNGSVEEEILFAIKSFHSYEKTHGNIISKNDYIEQTLSDILKKLDLEKYRHTFPYNLSNGEKSRLAIATCLIPPPSIFLMDEPTSGQDINHINNIMNVISSFSSIKSLVFCTHDIDFAIEYANRFLFVLDGCIIIDDDIKQLPNYIEELERYGFFLDSIRKKALSLNIPIYLKKETIFNIIKEKG